SQQHNIGQFQSLQDVVDILCETLNLIAMIHFLGISMAPHFKGDTAISFTQAVELMTKLLSGAIPAMKHQQKWSGASLEIVEVCTITCSDVLRFDSFIGHILPLFEAVRANRTQYTSDCQRRWACREVLGFSSCLSFFCFKKGDKREPARANSK